MQTLIEKAAVLIEALPYIQKFRHAVVVVKYGGSTMENRDPQGILRDIVCMECVGMRPVVVHGGGGAISRRLKEQGISPRFVGGLRVTDDETIRVVEQVLSDVNRGIVETIKDLGGKAEGISWKDGVVGARKHSVEVEKGGRTERVEIGFVGDVTGINTRPLQSLCRKDVIPVMTSIGVDKKGRRYNINADTVAGEVAKALGARKLVLLTDVRGILREPGNNDSLIEHLSTSDIGELKSAGVITEGMLPKIDAALRAVEAGVRKTHIIDGGLPHSLLLELFTDKGIGTEIVKPNNS